MRRLMVPTVDDPVLLTLEQARAHLHIGDSAIKRLIRSGRISVVSLGRKKLITRRALEAFVASLEAQSGHVA